MKKMLNYHVATLLIVLFSAMALCSCGDDDDDVVLESYIIGSWHSYKAIVHYLDESKTLNISKNGDNSSVYWEYDFNKDGTVTVHFWAQDDNGMSHWVENKGIYEVRGDEVRTKGSSSNSGNVISLFFDSKDRSLYIRHSQTTNGMQVATYVYLRK